MNFPRIAFLFFILTATLILSTFFGVHSNKEGLSYNNTILLSDIVFNTNSQNAAESIEAIKMMQLDDSDFAKIINSNLTDLDKITQLKALLTVILMSDIHPDTLQNVYDTNISLSAAINNVRSNLSHGTDNNTIPI